MIIPPTPTAPRSPVRRGVRAAGLAAPVALLAIAVAAAVLGPRSSGPAPLPRPSAAAPTSGVPGASSAPPVPDRAREPAPPAAFEGIAVARFAYPPSGSDSAAGEVIALTGRLLVDEPIDQACAARQDDPLGPWCERRAWLLVAPSSDDVTPPNLALRVPVGIELPVETSADTPVRRPVVVVLARWRSVDATCPAVADCDAELVVERFAWAGGERVDISPVVDPRLPPGSRTDPFARLDPGVVPLSALLALPQNLPTGGPAEAAADAQPGGAAWYLRIARLDDAGPPTAWWVVLAEGDLHVLGSGTGTDEAAGGRSGPG